MRQGDTDQLIGQIMALVTARFEDGAGLAVEGQMPQSEIIEPLVNTLRSHARQIMVLLDAVEVVAEISTSD